MLEWWVTISGIMWLRIYSYKCKESEPTLNFNKLGRITCIIYSLAISLVYFKRYFWLVKLHEETLNSYVVWVCRKFLFQYLVPISIHRTAIVTPTKLVWPWNVVHMTLSFLDPSSHEPQLPEGDCLHELPEEVQSRRDESNTATYWDLSLDTMDYTSMYSKIQDSCRPQTLTVARGGHVYAVVDPSKVEPPSQYDKIQWAW